MLTLLKVIIEVFTFVPDYIIFAVESVFNIFSEAVTVIFTAATSIIELPEEPEAPEYISDINWFFPIGPMIAIATPIVTAYVSFLAIRWIFAKVGDL